MGPGGSVIVSRWVFTSFFRLQNIIRLLGRLDQRLTEMSLGGKPLTSTVDGHQGVTRETSVRPCLTENSPFSRHPPSTTRGRFEGRYSSPFKAPRNARKPRGGLEARDGVVEPVSIIFNTSSWYYPLIGQFWQFTSALGSITWLLSHNAKQTWVIYQEENVRFGP